ncbi:glycine zipper 2TM domain-containing protein [Shewanella sp. 202IG2-18]|uniref:glycine zipper 2TM domain-containing protein n=1 Tax=Parashewanella hymeniacidonis TaxID=2807618 RepID=UPI0019611323|nr:glycine zipper 2TM domain-containing protein [Parashewanella hymeniacidonis]MBM7073595.1 glycine zipper 2TM domain-containing protein [Parashewanella hymeniacidonis]
MIKPKLVSFILLCLFSSLAFASGPYNRNKAQPVKEVVYGDVTSIRSITQQEIIKDKNSGWKTFGGALLGGVIGNQFGKGSGRDIATVLGAIAGGSIANQQSSQPRYREYKLIEMMIKQDDGKSVMIVQDLDPGMPFKAGDRVRVVYLENSVRVDIAM